MNERKIVRIHLLMKRIKFFSASFVIFRKRERYVFMYVYVYVYVYLTAFRSVSIVHLHQFHNNYDIKRQNKIRNTNADKKKIPEKINHDRLSFSNIHT